MYAFADELAKERTPVLAGDEDEGRLEPALMLKRTIPTAGLVVVPCTGPHRQLGGTRRINHAVDRFLTALARRLA